MLNGGQYCTLIDTLSCSYSTKALISLLVNVNSELPSLMRKRKKDRMLMTEREHLIRLLFCYVYKLLIFRPQRAQMA